MDPNCTWRDLILAHHEGDLDRVDELASALLDWLAKGGFPPRIGTIDVPNEARGAFVRHACESLLSRFAPTDR